MIGGIPEYILQAAHRRALRTSFTAAQSPANPQPAAETPRRRHKINAPAAKPPLTTRFVLESTLKPASAVSAFPSARHQLKNTRLSPAQRCAVASAVQTAMERMLCGKGETDRAAAINDMMQEIEATLCR